MPQLRAVGTRWKGHTSWDIKTADCGEEGSDSKARCPHSTKRKPRFPAPPHFPDLGIAILFSLMVTTSSGFDNAGLNSGRRLGWMHWAEGLSSCPTGVQPSGASWTPRLPLSPLLW